MRKDFLEGSLEDRESDAVQSGEAPVNAQPSVSEAPPPLAATDAAASADAASDRSDPESESEEEEETELGGSKLGRLEYWDQAYKEELANFADHGDEGEVWFGREVLDTVVHWTAELLRQLYGPENAKTLDVLDVGCGNGTMLVGLAAQGFERLAGSDYSLEAVELARKVLVKHGLEERVRVRSEDLLIADDGNSVHVITDKGTLDAIGLSTNPNARKQYRSAVWHRLHPGGHLIVTSCNSTREELVEEFGGGNAPREPCAFNPDCRHSRWKVVDWVKTHPKFKFGGVEGSKVCTVAFEKLLLDHQ